MLGAKTFGSIQARAMRSCTRVRLGLLQNVKVGEMVTSAYDGHGIQHQRTLSRLGRNAKPIGVQSVEKVMDGTRKSIFHGAWVTLGLGTAGQVWIGTRIRTLL